MNINDSLNSLRETGFKLDENFINSDKKYSILILNQLKYFLELFEEEGIELTKIGNLPTKVVKSFILNADGGNEHFMGKRYTEDDSMLIQKIKLIAQIAKLVIKRKNILSLTKKGRDFLASSDAQQFIFLFEHYYSKLNYAYFDRYEDKGLAQQFSLNIAHIVYSQNQYLDAPSYVQHFLKLYPQVEELINDLVEQSSYTSTKLEEFNRIVKIRVFDRFLIPFGLIEHKNDKYIVSDFFRSIMMQGPAQESLTIEILSGKLIKETDQMFKELGYKVDMFFDFFLISGIFAAKNEINFLSTVADTLVRYKVKSQDENSFIEIYTHYYALVSNLYNYLLHDDRADEPESVLIEKIGSLSSALFHQLPMTLLPGALLHSVEQIVSPLLLVFDSYGVNMQTSDFLQQVEEKMGHFAYDKVEHFFMLMSHFAKETKKSKRVTKEMISDVKMIIMSFIVVCWDVMIRHEENDEL